MDKFISLLNFLKAYPNVDNNILFIGCMKIVHLAEVTATKLMRLFLTLTHTKMFGFRDFDLSMRIVYSLTYRIKPYVPHP